MALFINNGTNPYAGGDGDYGALVERMDEVEVKVAAAERAIDTIEGDVQDISSNYLHAFDERTYILRLITPGGQENRGIPYILDQLPRTDDYNYPYVDIPYDGWIQFVTFPCLVSYYTPLTSEWVHNKPSPSIYKNQYHQLDIHVGPVWNTLTEHYVFRNDKINSSDTSYCEGANYWDIKYWPYIPVKAGQRLEFPMYRMRWYSTNNTWEDNHEDFWDMQVTLYTNDSAAENDPRRM